jgi:hypothetical protein
MNWMYLAQNRGQWMAFVNTVMNFQVLCNVGIVMSKGTNPAFSIMTQFYKISELILANT